MLLLSNSWPFRGIASETVFAHDSNIIAIGNARNDANVVVFTGIMCVDAPLGAVRKPSPAALPRIPLREVSDPHIARHTLFILIERRLS